MLAEEGDDDDDEHDCVMSNLVLKMCCSSQPGMRCRSLRFAGFAGASSGPLREVHASPQISGYISPDRLQVLRHTLMST